MARNRSFESYAKHLRVYGPAGLLKAAESDLSVEDYERLVKLVKALKRSHTPRKRR